MAYTKKQTLKYVFSEKHKEYIRSCVSCEFNVAEGAVRAGKTVDNVYAFAHELRPRQIAFIWQLDQLSEMQSLTSVTVTALVWSTYSGGNATGGSTKTTKLCTSKVRQPDSSRRSLSLLELPKRTVLRRSEAIHTACGLQLRSTCITTARSKRH